MARATSGKASECGSGLLIKKSLAFRNALSTRHRFPAAADWFDFSPNHQVRCLYSLADPAVPCGKLKKLSSGAAARLAGVSRVEFLKRLGEYGVSVFDMSEQEFEQETRLG